MKTRRRNSTGANRGNGGRNENLCSLCFLLFKSGPGGVVQLDFDKSISDGVNMNPEGFRGYAKRGDEADFVFLPAVPVYQLSTLNPQLFRNCANTKPSMSKA